MKFDLHRLVDRHASNAADISLAVACWVIISVMVFTPAVPLMNWITAIGALGQVAFAGLVWSLTRQQFRLSKVLADRQRDLELYDRRKALADTIKGLLPFTTASKIEHEIHDVLCELISEADALFDIDVLRAMQELSSAYDDALRAKDVADIMVKAGRENEDQFTAVMEALRRANGRLAVCRVNIPQVLANAMSFNRFKLPDA